MRSETPPGRPLARGRARAVGLLMLLCGTSLRADDAHYQNLLVGERAGALGGAYTAIADDVSGLYYNPAGIVDAKRASLSVSASLLGLERRVHGGGLDTAATWADALAGEPPRSGEINLVPTTSGSVITFGPRQTDGSHAHGVAFGLLVPSFRAVDQRETFHEGDLTIVHSTRLNDRLYVAGAGYAYRVNPWLRLGAAAHTTMRLVQSTEAYSLDAGVDVSGAPSRLQSVADLDLTQVALQGGIGLKASPFRYWLFGISLTSSSVALYQMGALRLEQTRLNLPASPEDPPSTHIGEESPVEWDGAVRPWSLRLGIARTWPGATTASFDLAIYLPTRYRLSNNSCRIGAIGGLSPICQLLGAAESNELEAAARQRSPLPVAVERKLTANVAAGVEHALVPNVLIGGGIFTDFSSAPDFLLTPQGYLTDSSSVVSRVGHVGATLSVGWAGAFTVSRFGLLGLLGQGQTVRPASTTLAATDRGQLRLQPVETQELLLFLYWASTFRYGEHRTRFADDDST